MNTMLRKLAGCIVQDVDIKLHDVAECVERHFRVRFQNNRKRDRLNILYASSRQSLSDALKYIEAGMHPFYYG